MAELTNYYLPLLIQPCLQKCMNCPDFDTCSSCFQ